MWSGHLPRTAHMRQVGAPPYFLCTPQVSGRHSSAFRARPQSNTAGATDWSTFGRLSGPQNVSAGSPEEQGAHGDELGSRSDRGSFGVMLAQLARAVTYDVIRPSGDAGKPRFGRRLVLLCSRASAERRAHVCRARGPASARRFRAAVDAR